MKNEIKNEIKSYIALSGLTLTKIVEKLNQSRKSKDEQYQSTTQSNLSNKLSRGTIKYSEVKEMANIMGYDIIWIKKEK